MSNEQIFGNIIMLFSRFEMMMQSMERQNEQMSQAFLKEREKNEELQNKNNDLQSAFDKLKVENHKLNKDIEALTHVPEEPMPEQSNEDFSE